MTNWIFKEKDHDIGRIASLSILSTLNSVSTAVGTVSLPNRNQMFQQNLPQFQVKK